MISPQNTMQVMSLSLSLSCRADLPTNSTHSFPAIYHISQIHAQYTCDTFTRRGRLRLLLYVGVVLLPALQAKVIDICNLMHGIACPPYQDHVRFFLFSLLFLYLRTVAF
ncbi:hypothetical protein IWW34DRAFT_158007 [Fusarium oxysporum f. sp. albedinis]|nr:hypothetical protein IWW34DRAFT_158007 [Fusarium oxysporum f. sp. albedinis]